MSKNQLGLFGHVADCVIHVLSIVNYVTTDCVIHVLNIVNYVTWRIAYMEIVN